jgi:integrase
VRAYAVSLKLWFEFLAWADVGWAEVGIEDVARFVAWLRAPAPNVVVLADGTGARRPATVNRYLAGVFGFYDHHARSGLGVAAELVAWRRVARGSYKPFMHHVTKGRPIAVRPVKLHVPRQAPRTLAPEQIIAVLAATEHLRDRFLLSLLAETGMRVGQALGLRHSDFVSHRREVHIVPRADNANKARAKVRSMSVVPVSAPLVRLYSEYMHTEYGDIDSDYVFVNLFAGQVGRPMAYPTVHDLIDRVGARSGVSFNAHMMPADLPVALAKANARRHQSALSAAQGTIERLCREGRPVNFGVVARAAGVSRAWLYRQADLRDHIGHLRSTTAPAPAPVAQRASVASLHQRLGTAKAEVTRLKAENTALRDQLARQLGAQRARADKG